MFSTAETRAAVWKAKTTCHPMPPEDIKKIILFIHSDAVGCDDISLCMIATSLDCILLAINHLINCSLNFEIFLSLWRKADIIPLPKNKKRTLPEHFCPISILSFLSKVLKACVYKQLSQFIHRNQL